MWREEKVVATSADVIAILDAATSQPLTTRGELLPDRDVLVFAMKAFDPEWASIPGRALVRPRHSDLDYVSVTGAVGMALL